MAYTYDIKTSKKDSRANISLFSCHTVLGIVDLFISTFLVAHIFNYCNSTAEYIFAVGQFYLANYAYNIIAIWLISYLIDKTNRVWMYRFSLVLELGIVLVAIFFGDKIAAIAWLGGLMRGIFESFYYPSYNVLKQEMVSRKSMKSFAIWLQVVSKAVGIVVPVALGALISVSTYSNIAIYIAVVCVIQIGVSFGIKSHTPEGSQFRLTGYNKKLSQNPEAKRIMRFVYLGCLIYGFTTCAPILVNICIMFQYGSLLSLGVITSIFAVVSMAIILFAGKFTRQGKRATFFIVLAAISLAGAIVFVSYPSKTTLIIYNLCATLANAIFNYVFDIYRNGNLKELGLYSEISEHQAVTEIIFCAARVVSFCTIMLLGLWGSIAAFYVALVLFTLISSAMLVYLVFYEKNYLLKDNAEPNNGSVN